MVSRLTPASRAKAPMVRLGRWLCIALDSVHDYGSNLKPSISHSKGDRHAGTAKRRRPSCRRGTRRDSRLDLLPGAAAVDHAGIQRCLDRQPERAGTIPATLYRLSTAGAVLRLATDLPSCSGLHTGRSLCHPSGTPQLQAAVLGSAGIGAGGARLPLRSSMVLLIRRSS